MSNVPPMNSEFEKARDEKAYQKQQDELVVTKMYETQVATGHIDEDQAPVQLNASRINGTESQHGKKSKEKQHTDMTMLLILLNQLERNLEILEANLAVKYGENFAEQLAADLLPLEKFEELIKIEDDEERRRAIAQAINDGIRNGTIDPNDPRINDDYREWLDKHDEVSGAVLEASKNPATASLDERSEVSYAASLDAMLS